MGRCAPLTDKSLKEFLLVEFLQDAYQSCHRVIKRLSLGKNAIVFKCIIDQHARDASRSDISDIFDNETMR